MFLINKSTSGTITRIAVLGLLGGVILSWPLWNADERLWFPLLPARGGAIHPASLFEGAATLEWGGLIVFLIAAFVFPGKKPALALLIVWLAALCLHDLNRLQPWVWFYGLVFIAGIAGTPAQTEQALRWLMAGVYGWSGFSKITPYFAEDNFAWFCEAFSFTRPMGTVPLLGYSIAVLEMSFAVGLLWKKTRPYFRWIAIGLHVIIIAFLLKLDWNRVVIPWNLAMAGMVWVLYPTPVADAPVNAVAGKNGNRAQALVIGLVWIAPLFYHVQCWPQALSWQLYSNTQPETTFFSKTRVTYSSIPAEIVWETYAFDNRSKMLLDDWANGELEVPMFASGRTNRQLGRYLCDCLNSDSAGVIILTVNPWNKAAEKMNTIPCNELK